MRLSQTHPVRHLPFTHLSACEGGNQSWSGRVKSLNSEEYDYLLVLSRTAAKWFIPSSAVDGATGLLLGGPKYERFEVDVPPANARRMGEAGFEPA